MNLQSMTYLELLKLMNKIELEMLIRTLPLFVIILVIVITATILKEWGENK